MRMRKWRKLWHSETGLAYLEFALALPFLMLLFIGGVEMSRYVQAAQKVDKMTHTIVDLIAQAPTVSESDLDRIMLAVEHIMEPHEFRDDGVIIVTCVGYNSAGNLQVKWQYKGGGTLDRNSLIGAVGGAPTLPPGFTLEARDNVIIAESYFALTSMINDELLEPIEFYRTAYYLPRLGALDTLAQN